MGKWRDLLSLFLCSERLFPSRLMLGTSMASRDTFKYFITSSAVLKGMNCMLSQLWVILVPAQFPLGAFWLALQLWPGQAAGCSRPAEHWDGAGAWWYVQGSIGQGSGTQAVKEDLVCSAEMYVYEVCTYPSLTVANGAAQMKLGCQWQEHFACPAVVQGCPQVSWAAFSCATAVCGV